MNQALYGKMIKIPNYKTKIIYHMAKFQPCSSTANPLIGPGKFAQNSQKPPQIINGSPHKKNSTRFGIYAGR